MIGDNAEADVNGATRADLGAAVDWLLSRRS